MNSIVKYIAISAGLLMSYSGMAQNNHGIGLHFGGIDHYGPQTGKYFLQKRDVKEGKDTVQKNMLLWKSMIKGTYWIPLGKRFDLSFNVNLSGRVDHPDSNDDTMFVQRQDSRNPFEVAKIFAEFGPRVNFNILPREEFIVSPYLLAGVNAAWYEIGGWRASAPLGLGFNVQLAKPLSLNLETNYNVPLTKKSQSHLVHSIGMVYWFNPKYKHEISKPVEAPAKVVVADTDGDGVADANDACPTIAGLPAFAGCPDSDGDGVSDKDDACPLVAGNRSMNGCPDSDNDGINDKEDKCPYVAGLAERGGCPVPDKDGDGFNDNEDRCPELYSKTNGGCPEIRQEVINKVSKAAKAIFFETGKSTIKKTSYKSLDAVAAILKEDATLFADIEGHTDNVGDDNYNMQLSNDRAAAVKDYLIGKGIAAERLSSQGFGETMPVATNETAAGKAQNRRTEIKLRNYSK